MVNRTAELLELDTLGATLAFHAAAQPERTAIISAGRRVTYEQLHHESDKGARALCADGLVRGKRVAFFGRESELYYEILFACAKSGAVLVPVNWRLAADEIEYILQDAETEVLFVEEEFLDVVERLSTVSARLRTLVLLDCSTPSGITFEEWKSGSPETFPLPADLRTDDPVVQLYTSGTTGAPKGAVLAHRSFFAVRDALAGSKLDWVDWKPDDISLVAISASHVGGLWWALQGFNAGVTNVTLGAFTSKEVLALLRDLGVTTTCVVPQMLRLLLADPEVSGSDFVTLRKIVYGGSPMPDELLGRCMEMMNCDFVQFYGLTETGNTVVCLPPSDHAPGAAPPGAAGRPYPGFEVKITDPKGGALPPGENGEVRVRTPGHMVEYWRLPEATANTLDEGWILTGDAGHLDENGYLFIEDRIKNMIIRAGENIYPAEIEKALNAHPAVAEAAVVGVPDDRWGEAVHAFVALRPLQEASPQQLRAFLKGRIADFKIPTRFEFIDKIPRNPTGKILHRNLRDRFWEARDKKVN
ncbi:long-chain-fatty-acid--CoA ligase [Streptomyces ipomoeae]|uniref:long-chain-fatty-acid--CoA ligase n=1 Tax=Streptomyces ipomoeae TaxID=103232 RepID=UPI001147716B|nr:long-chain-fatty-acid--CoA ligase [Streptomyces ipomoeae]MDX2937675.1 long-chain-fatty-acid--CoA ligase [Streptomyces ipomoeae]TQE22770.1 long-chain-fatty-acid--CoA ligase [Streptomyces ipomoeae]